LRKIFFFLVAILGIWFIYTQLSEFKTIAETVKKGEWLFLMSSLLAALGWIAYTGFIYKSIYKMVGLEESWLPLTMTFAAGFFVNIISTAGAATSLAVFLVDGKRRGHPTSRVTVAWALNMLFETIGLLSVVILGLAVLARRNNLQWGEITASILLLIIALGISALLYLGMKSTRLLGNVLAWCVERINWLLRPILRREFSSPESAQLFAFEAADGVALLRQYPRRLIILALMAIGSKSLLMLIFLLCFLAYQVPFSTGTIIAGFSMGYQFAVVSPTPAGIGIVESVWPIFLRSLGVATGAATVIMLTFRALTFWIPLLIGFIAFRLLPNLPHPVNSQEIMPSNPDIQL
jgi:uncharacterized protein (TIRG00374 family)